jgi:hypothetical protein
LPLPLFDHRAAQKNISPTILTEGRLAAKTHSDRATRLVKCFATVLMLPVLCGGGCQHRLTWLPWSQPAVPQILSANPSLDEVIRTVNANSSLVRSMSTNYATLSGQGTPSLRAAVFVERPGRFRIRGTHALTGPEVDLGCNDEMFWLWVKRAEPHALYFARHNTTGGPSGMQRLIPLTPQQLVEAFGIPMLDPQAAHQGPFQQGPQRLAIRTSIVGPAGMMTKTTLIDARSGWVVEQQLHDANNQLVATVKTTDHRIDPASRAALPHSIELSIPSGGLALSMSIDHWDVNVQPPADAWQKPEQPGYPNVDIADPRNFPGVPPSAAALPGARTTGAASTTNPQAVAALRETNGANQPAAYDAPAAGRARYGERPPPATATVPTPITTANRDTGWRADDDTRR